MPLPPAAVPPPERCSSPGIRARGPGLLEGRHPVEAAWAPRAGRLSSRRGCRSRRRAVGAGALPEPGARARPRPRARGAACEGLPPPPAVLGPGAAGGGRASGRGSVPGSVPGGGLPPAGSPEHSLEALGGCLLAVTCSSGSCLRSTLEPPAGVGAVCAYRSWTKEIERSRLVLIAFHLLKGVCNFCLGVLHGFPNLFCKSQMIQCSLVCVYIYIHT